MLLMKHKLLFLGVLFILYQNIGFAQLTPMFEWSSMLPYNQAKCVTEADEYVYVGTSTGLVRVAKSDYSIRRFSKEDGMADFDIAALGYSNSTQSLIIGYKNGNIDVLIGGEFYNLPEIINSGSISTKVIHSITVKNNLAYICAGYGISIVDLNNRKFKSTAKFQPAGQPEFSVYDIAIDEHKIYAATAKGLYEYSDLNLFEDFGSWNLMSGLPNGHFTFAEIFNNKLYTVYSNLATHAIDDDDTLFFLNGTNFVPSTEVVNATITGLKENRNKLVINYKTSGINYVLAKNIDWSDYVSTTNAYFSNTSASVYAQDGKIYIPDFYFGLVVLHASEHVDLISVPGPFSNRARKITFQDNTINIASGGFSPNFGDAYIGEGLFFNKDNNWSFQNFLNQPLLIGASDFVCLANDPKSKNTVYAGALTGGLYKFEDQICVQKYDYASTGGLIGTASKSSVYAIQPDEKGNLFIAHNGATPVSILKQDGSIISFPIPYVNSSDKILDIVHVTNDIVWFATYGKGIIAIKHENYVPTNVRQLTTAVGNGKLTSMSVTSIKKDKDGEVWAGTINGFTIFYNPQSVFTSGVNIDASQPIVKADDGNNEPVLKGANILSITVDGGNRKWICMQGAGVTLLSEDGFKIEQSFTKSNSPLLGDNVFNADIDPKTGMVYFSTENGISIFRSNATEATDKFEDVYAFPNPVRPGYNGYVTITGLAEGAEVKITDSNGQLIYETFAKGGTATWNLYSFNGQKAKSGVYLVFTNGEQKKSKHVTKILIMQ